MHVLRAFRGKRVAIVGSGPGCLDNEPGNIDSFDVVVRVNSYKLSAATGFRTDVFYSFFGASIKKTPAELHRDGVRLCMAKCPDAHVFASEWHMQQGRQQGADFRYIYDAWDKKFFCPTYVPKVWQFLEHFHMLGGHIPTTGFSAILDVLACGPSLLYLTGFDFFASGIHNVNERWRPGNPNDPIGHTPAGEREWLRKNMSPIIQPDSRLAQVLR